MLEVMFISLIAGLFVYQVTFFRKLTKKQVNQTLRTLVTDFEPDSIREKVVTIPTQPVAIQQPVNRSNK
ncbi:hypothetical protein [Paucisalibacillus globulus]|uniref:hypothetical protein n=1 Tax=Paucisalibacillus globulus TaxID=351095 RepID=UPI000BB97978|nr:hypothetical protein [Paucisalibacillus globulus]